MQKLTVLSNVNISAFTFQLNGTFCIQVIVKGVLMYSQRLSCLGFADNLPKPLFYLNRQGFRLVLS